MGTVFSLTVVDVVDPLAVAAVFDWLREVDERFSTYRPESEISRLGRAELAPADLSADAREVLALCERARIITGGWFDIRRHRTDGVPDPSGLVKGWAIERAAAMLTAAGVRNWTLSGGGDVVTRGTREGLPWRVGIQDPASAAHLSVVLEPGDAAVATSGLYERGGHIVDPHTGRVPTELLSMTVVGPSMTWADTYATAAFAMGEAGLGWLAGMPGYSAGAVTADGRLLVTPGFRRLIADPNG